MKHMYAIMQYAVRARYRYIQVGCLLAGAATSVTPMSATYLHNRGADYTGETY